MFDSNTGIQQASLATDSKPVVIIGAGPAGLRVAKNILEQKPEQKIIIYGGEPWSPYNRVKLSSLLGGFESPQDIFEEQIQHENINIIHNCPIREIDSLRNRVIDQQGNKQTYSSLVIATGSLPHVPNLRGIELDGVYTFRNLRDAEELSARQIRSHKTVVIGGGVLGIEAARAMQRFNTDVTIVEHTPRLMGKQLDDNSSDMLITKLQQRNINVLCNHQVKCISGESRVEGIEFSDGTRINCDTVIISTGIIPNIALAKTCGLAIGRGIKVDNHMRSSAKHIYAVGECAEHNGQVHGLVAPGFEQASVAAHSIINHSDTPVHYNSSISATRLKVVDETVFSMGPVSDDEQLFTYKSRLYVDKDNGIYRKLVLKNNRLHGAIIYGKWDSLGRVQESIQQHRFILPWQLSRFLKTGELWLDEQSSVTAWPASAVVCNCTGVTRGEISNCIESGCSTGYEIAETTGASSVCGSCKPLIFELLDNDSAPEPNDHYLTISISTILALSIFALFAFLPAIEFSASVQKTTLFETLISDGLYKQVSGYTAFGLMLLVGIMSLRKRFKFFSPGKYSYFRTMHVIAALIAIISLVVHSGFYLGDNFNQKLMFGMFAVIATGLLFGMQFSIEHRLSTSTARLSRQLISWLHILTFWPLPVLLSFHVLSVYYF